MLTPSAISSPSSRSAQFAPALIAWQRVHGRRDLPWQNTQDPYRVWLSEIMLQQTQVATVLRYYDRFLERFPNVLALAQAPLDEVLAAWSGLGYYRRARLAHACAQRVARDHGGEFPRTAAVLATLPGIGRSTAAAIAAFCFAEKAAILDGNVKRVLTRWLGFDGDVTRAAELKQLWDAAESLLPDTDIAPYTQGLMDLGASLCAARQPACARCPVASSCVARADGNPERYPVAERTVKRHRRASVCLWLEHRGRVWLTQRPPQGIWAGLWSLPMWDDFEALRAASLNWPGEGEAWPTIEHVLTHVDWTLWPRRWQLPADFDADAFVHEQASRGDVATAPSWTEGRWVSRDEALSLALPTPWRRLISERLPAD
jgi:A/G-specific adenine glycosylase